jgi:hypothetical protein
VFKLSAVNRINVVNVLTRRAVPARNRSSIPSGGKEFSSLRTTVREQFGVHPASCAVGRVPHGAGWDMNPSGVESKYVCSCNSTIHILCFKSVEWRRSFECNAFKVY